MRTPRDAAHSRHRGRPSLWPRGGHGPYPGVCEVTQASGDRGQRSGHRRVLQRAADRLARRRRVPQFLPHEKSGRVWRRGNGGDEFSRTRGAHSNAAESRPGGKIPEQRAGLEQPPRRNPGGNSARKVASSFELAARSPIACRGIQSALLPDSRRHAAARARGIRTRLPPVHHSNRTARRPPKISERKKNRKHGLLSLPTASTAAVLGARPQGGRLPALGARRERSTFAADVSGIAQRTNCARRGNDRRISEVLNAPRLLFPSLPKSTTTST